MHIMPEPQGHRLAQSHIVSSGQAQSPREVVTPEVILILTFIIALHELLDRKEHRADDYIAHLAEPFQSEEAILSP